MMQWFLNHSIEIFAVVFSVIYLILSIKQNILLWFFGIISVTLYMYVYFVSRFYADMILQVFYLFMSIYGWIVWKYQKTNNKKELEITKISINKFSILLVIFAVLWILFYLALNSIPEMLNIQSSAFPVWDSFTTAGGIVGTYMLARKIIEHWWLWVVVDIIALILYVSKELYPTALLFLIYTIMAVIGYFEWKKSYKIQAL